MNCQSFKTQIDEAAFTAELERHLAACSDCKTFREERECLSRLLSKLECVNAPANFEFGVRAKLNSLPAAPGRRVWVRRFVFASPALAAVAVSAFVFTSYNDFSPTPEQTPVAVQINNPAPAQNPSPIALPTEPNLATANTNPVVEMPVPAKQRNLSVPKTDRQAAFDKVLVTQSNSVTRKSDKDPVMGRNADEPINSRQEALNPAPTPLVQPEFRSGVTGKIAPDKALSIFGIDKITKDGMIESVGSNSIAAESGILAGDKIEMINGQKYGADDLDNAIKEVTLEILRNGVKRIIKLEVIPPK